MCLLYMSHVKTVVWYGRCIWYIHDVARVGASTRLEHWPTFRWMVLDVHNPYQGDAASISSKINGSLPNTCMTWFNSTLRDDQTLPVQHIVFFCERSLTQSNKCQARFTKVFFSFSCEHRRNDRSANEMSFGEVEFARNLPCQLRHLPSCISIYCSIFLGVSAVSWAEDQQLIISSFLEWMWWKLHLPLHRLLDLSPVIEAVAPLHRSVFAFHQSFGAASSAQLEALEYRCWSGFTSTRGWSVFKRYCTTM